MKASQVISDKVEVLAHLARVCHAHAQGSLLEHIPIEERFNSGNRQVIIELYGRKIVELSKSRVLRFHDALDGIDDHTVFYFREKLAKALDGVISQDHFPYDAGRIVALIMGEFEVIPRYKNYSLVLP